MFLWFQFPFILLAVFTFMQWYYYILMFLCLQNSIHQKTRRRRRKKKSYFTLCSILCTFNYLLQIHYKICKILCSINPFMVSFSLIYFSLDFCVLLDLRFRDLIIYLEVTNLLIMKQDENKFNILVGLFIHAYNFLYFFLIINVVLVSDESWKS